MHAQPKVAIVTGAARGIGLAIAQALAREGVIPVVADIDGPGARRAAQAIRKTGIPALPCTVDVSDVSQIARMTEQVLGEYGRIDILVNNAGVLSTAAIDDLTEAEWDRVLGINVKGAAFLSQQALRPMLRQGWGRIVNVASMAGRMGGFSTGCAYSASKAALIGLTMCLARKVAASHITVNAIAPGPTRSELIQGFTAEEVRGLEASIPMGRMAEPQDIAAAAVFLASEAAGFITGAVIDANGGAFMG